MADPFEQLLLSAPTKKVSPDVLEMLGHKAARAFIDQKVPLNMAVAQAVKAHPELGNEHIKRVVEFANNVTFQELFQSSPDKNVHFPVADPGVILRDLRDGGSPGHEQVLHTGTKDYASPPTMQKTEGMGVVDDALQDITVSEGNEGQYGQGEPIEKNAYAQLGDVSGHANPYENVYALHTKLRGSEERLNEAMVHFEGIQKEAAEDLYQAIKTEVISPDGAGLGGVMGVLEKLGGKDTAAAVLEGVVERLIADGVRPDQLETSLEKRAGQFMNPQHPIPSSFAGMLKAAEERLGAALSLKEVRDGLQETSAFLSRGA